MLGVAGTQRLLAMLAGAGVAAGLLFGGCGSDDDGSSGGGSKSQGGAGGEVDGSAGSGGSGGSGGTSGGTGGGSGAGGGGPTCDQVPPTPDALLTQCHGDAGPTAFDACGGEIPMGTWELATVCETSPYSFTFLRTAVCSSLDPSAAQVVRSVRGSLTIGDGEMIRAIDADLEVTMDVPVTCGHQCNCEDWAKNVSQNLGVLTTCGPSCNGDGACSCTFDLSMDFERRMTFTTNGGRITADEIGTSPSTDWQADYCVDGSELKIHDSSYEGFTPSNITLERRAPLTFEICDGFDNDEDGQVDEDPSDCNPCLVEGVCAAGAQHACVSGAWDCTYAAPDYEEVEQAWRRQGQRLQRRGRRRRRLLRHGIRL